MARHGYVAAGTGWFSERSAGYLAMGRPVVTEDTGFSDWLPSGLGVVAFASPEQAAAGVQDVQARYRLHCRAVSDIARQYFDSRVVLESLIDRAQ